MLKCEHFIDSIYYQLEQTAKYCRYLGMQLFQKLDLPINLDEFVVLDTLLGHEGICQRDLAKLILKDRATTGRLLDSLEGKKLITRFIDMKNNRLVRKMGVTEEGKVVFDRIQAKLKIAIHNANADMVPEKDIEFVRKTLKKIRDNFKQIVDMQI